MAKPCYAALVAVFVLLVTGCASSGNDQARRAIIDAEIETILETPAAVGVAGAGPVAPVVERCLAEFDYRSFRPLDDRRILFVGSRDRYWLNTLRNRCPELAYSDTLVTRSFSPMRMCAGDNFTATDWFTWPWYRRWPWRWGGMWSSGGICTLGQFQEISEEQAVAIEAAIDARR